MSSLNEAKKELLDAIDVMVSGKIDKMKYNYYLVGVVTEVDKYNKTYKVNINGNYFDLIARQGLTVGVNDIVYVCVANNDFSNKFIDVVLGQTKGQDETLEKINEIQAKLLELMSGTVIDKEAMQKEISDMQVKTTKVSEKTNEMKNYVDTALSDNIIDGTEDFNIGEIKDTFNRDYNNMKLLVDDILLNEKISEQSKITLQNLITSLNEDKNGILEKVNLIQTMTHTELTKGELDEQISDFQNNVSAINRVLNEAIIEIHSYSTEELKYYLENEFKEGVLKESDLILFRKFLGDYRAELSALKTLVETSYTNTDNLSYNSLKSLTLDLDLMLNELIALETKLTTSDVITTEDRDLLQEAGQRIIDINNAISEYTKNEIENNNYIANEVYVAVNQLDSKLTNEISERTLWINNLKGDVSELKTNLKKSNDSISSINNSLSGLETEMKGAFKEGIIDEAEIMSLNSQVKLLENEKANFQKQYDLVKLNPNLKGLVKTELDNAYTSYEQIHTKLIDDINSVVMDNKITVEEKNTVEQDFIDYKQNLIILIEKLKKANDLIDDEKISTVISEQTSTFEQTIDSIRSEISQKVDPLKLEQELNSKKALIDADIQSARDDFNQKIANAEASTNELKSYIDGSFSDGILNAVEKNKINDLVEQVKIDYNMLEKTFINIISDKDLDELNKSELNKVYNSFNSAYVNFLNKLIDNSEGLLYNPDFNLRTNVGLNTETITDWKHTQLHSESKCPIVGFYNNSSKDNTLITTKIKKAMTNDKNYSLIIKLEPTNKEVSPKLVAKVHGSVVAEKEINNTNESIQIFEIANDLNSNTAFNLEISNAKDTLEEPSTGFIVKYANIIENSTGIDLGDISDETILEIDKLFLEYSKQRGTLEKEINDIFPVLAEIKDDKLRKDIDTFYSEKFARHEVTLDEIRTEVGKKTTTEEVNSLISAKADEITLNINQNVDSKIDDKIMSNNLIYDEKINSLNSSFDTRITDLTNNIDSIISADFKDGILNDVEIKELDNLLDRLTLENQRNVNTANKEINRLVASNLLTEQELKSLRNSISKPNTYLTAIQSLIDDIKLNGIDDIKRNNLRTEISNFNNSISNISSEILKTNDLLVKKREQAILEEVNSLNDKQSTISQTVDSIQLEVSSKPSQETVNQLINAGIQPINEQYSTISQKVNSIELEVSNKPSQETIDRMISDTETKYNTALDTLKNNLNIKITNDIQATSTEINNLINSTKSDTLSEVEINNLDSLLDRLTLENQKNVDTANKEIDRLIANELITETDLTDLRTSISKPNEVLTRILSHINNMKTNGITDINKGELNSLITEFNTSISNLNAEVIKTTDLLAKKRDEAIELKVSGLSEKYSTIEQNVDSINLQVGEKISDVNQKIAEINLKTDSIESSVVDLSKPKKGSLFLGGNFVTKAYKEVESFGIGHANLILKASIVSPILYNAANRKGFLEMEVGDLLSGENKPIGILADPINRRLKKGKYEIGICCKATPDIDFIPIVFSRDVNDNNNVFRFKRKEAISKKEDGYNVLYYMINLEEDIFLPRIIMIPDKLFNLDGTTEKLTFPLKVKQFREEMTENNTYYKQNKESIEKCNVNISWIRMIEGLGMEDEYFGFNTIGSLIQQANDEFNISIGGISTSGKVDPDKIVTSINASPNQIKINADKVNITGLVTFNDLKAGSTTIIDGSLIKTGSISANLIKGGTISGVKFVSKDAISNVTISDGKIMIKNEGVPDSTVGVEIGHGTINEAEGHGAYIKINGIAIHATDKNKGRLCINNDVITIGKEYNDLVERVEGVERNILNNYARKTDIPSMPNMSSYLTKTEASSTYLTKANATVVAVFG